MAIATVAHVGILGHGEAGCCRDGMECGSEEESKVGGRPARGQIHSFRLVYLWQDPLEKLPPEKSCKEFFCQSNDSFVHAVRCFLDDASFVTPEPGVKNDLASSERALNT